MKTLSIFFSLFIITSFVFSQDLNNNQDVISSGGSGTMVYLFDKSDKTVEGTPYVQDDFFPARVTAKKEEIFNLRYNAVTGEMEIKSNQINNPTINKNIQGIAVTFLKDNKTYISTTYFDKDGNTTVGFLLSLTQPNAKNRLFLQERKKFVESKPAKSSYQDAQPARFDKLNDVFYFAVGSDIAKPLSTNKKEIASNFPEHKNDILKFIGSEKLNVKKQDDLIKLFNYINNLQ